uniref:Uncharacterized protein n=1 Tax=Arundo donax TaxID=35708 RepID=A0A0A9GJC8_ARUDO
MHWGKDHGTPLSLSLRSCPQANHKEKSTDIIIIKE